VLYVCGFGLQVIIIVIVIYESRNTFKIGWTEAISVSLLLLEKNTISFCLAFEKKEKEKHVLKQIQVPISDVQLMCGFSNMCFTKETSWF